MNSQKTCYDNSLSGLQVQCREIKIKMKGVRREKKNNPVCLQNLHNRKILQALNSFLYSSWKYTLYHISEVLSFQIFLFCVWVPSLVSANCFLHQILANTLTFQGECDWFQNCINLILQHSTEVQWNKKLAINFP